LRPFISTAKRQGFSSDWLEVLSKVKPLFILPAVVRGDTRKTFKHGSIQQVVMAKTSRSDSRRAILRLIRKVCIAVALAGSALLFVSLGVDEYVTNQSSFNGFVPNWVPVGAGLGLIMSGVAFGVFLTLPNPPKSERVTSSDAEDESERS
jgi:hypothetical protein